MKIILVPHTPYKYRASVWAAAVGTDSPPQGLIITLQPEGRSIAVSDRSWRKLSYSEASGHNVFVQVITVRDLEPGRRYELTSHGGSRARISTLPSSLPEEGGRPFTVLLGSCFHQGNDQEGQYGRAVKLLPEEQKPDLKILSGDQVYLDIPIFTVKRAKEKLLAKDFMEKYLRSWTQRGSLGEGFLSVLETGGTFFTADDHEFWNNYPNWTTLIPLSWTKSGRRTWQRVSRTLYGDFQSDDPAQTGRCRRFDVGELSFFIADTRYFREEGNQRFMKDCDMYQLGVWVRGLEGPGILVVGQPIFDGPSGWFSSRFEDRSLADYEQYQELVKILHESTHSIVLMTGDVHYGRVVSVSLNIRPEPIKIIEVISSPTSLVNPFVGGSAKDPPEKFPPVAIPGIVPSAPTNHYMTAEDNFATLHFTKRGGKVRMRIRYWFPKQASASVLAGHCLPPLDL